MAIANIIQLRQLLAEKFPGLRTRAEEIPVVAKPCWATGMPALDERLGGGLAKQALTEVICPHRSSGGASLVAQLVRRAAALDQLVALIDGHDSFDPAPLPPAALARLLWLRCHSAEEALKAADLLARDGNLPIVLLDLALNPEAQLRKIPAPTWYRLQRLIEEREITFVVFTPRAMIAPAETRITLHARFSMHDFERETTAVVRDIEIEVAERHAEEALRRTA